MSPTVKLPGTQPPSPGSAVKVVVEGTAVAVFNVGGALFAIDATCPHAGGPLDRGPVSGTTVTCPWHGSRFDLRTGGVTQGPARRPVKAYRVRAEPDGLSLERGSTGDGP